MMAHQRHRKKCVRIVKFFKVRVFIFIFFSNQFFCYFEFFYEKVYKIKNIRIKKDLKKKKLLMAQQGHRPQCTSAIT